MTGFSLLAAAAACGDDGVNDQPDAGTGGPSNECVDTAAAEPPAGVFNEPGDFDTSGCTPGALAGFDLDGLWYLTPSTATPDPFAGSVIRMALTCEEGLAIQAGGIATSVPVQYSLLDDDYLLARAEADYGPFKFVQSALLCNRDDDGNLTGQWVQCYFSDFQEACVFNDVSVAPFGRVDGEEESDGIDLVSEWAGPVSDPWPYEAFTANVAVHEGVAYVVRYNDGLRIVDVSDPASPADLGFFPGEEDNYNDVIVMDHEGNTYALIASAAFGVLVVDVTDPANPVQVATFAPSEDPGHGVHRFMAETVAGQTRIYLADGFSHEVAVFDITNPTLPILLGRIATAPFPDPDIAIHAVFVKDHIAYINGSFGGMFVFDATDPANAVQTGYWIDPENPNQYSHFNWTTTAGGRAITVHGHEGYGADVDIIDVDPGSPEYMQQIGGFSIRPEVSIHNMQVFGERAYISYYQDGVRILDLADPTRPEQVAYYNTWDPATAPGTQFEGSIDLEVDLTTGLIYVAETPRGLVILRDNGLQTE